MTEIFEKEKRRIKDNSIGFLHGYYEQAFTNGLLDDWRGRAGLTKDEAEELINLIFEKMEVMN